MSTATRSRRYVSVLVVALLSGLILTPVNERAAEADWGAVSATQADVQRRVALGPQHTCAVLDDGRVQCWGANDDGQLGTGDTTTSTRPRTVVGITTAVAVAAGQRHTCALLHNRTVRCWGLDGSGQIGDGTPTIAATTTPTPVAGLDDATAIVAGAASTCARRANGRVACWGHDGSGQLGNGSPVGESGISATPVTVAGITDATAVASGDYHACVLLADHSVRCWGAGAQGRLGNGVTNADSPAPVPVTGFPAGTEITALAAGGQHTCALDGDGSAWCWGDDSEGQLGDGRSRLTETPPPVAANPVKVHNINDSDPKAVVITAGGLHTCALLADRTARCWGDGGRKQLAAFPEPAHGNPIAEPKLVSAGPAPDNPLTDIDALIAGGFHTCALLDGSLACWGYNFTGQLGLRRSQANSPVQTTALLGASAVTVGNRFACALQIPPGGSDAPDAPRVPACWGDDTLGQLGSTVPDLRSDVPVVVPNLNDVAQIEAGNGSTCALPRGSSTPWCWGRGTDGQLGDGTTTNRTAPGPASISGVVKVSVGGAFIGFGEHGIACAARSDQTARCWGFGQQGQLGNNDTASSSTPVTVLRLDDSTDPPTFPVLTGVTDVSAGGDHACAVAGGGKIWCWGAGGVGQLGNGETDPSPVGVQVKDITGATSVSAGRSHTCALIGRDVKCWGRGTSGQLGDGATSNRVEPVKADLPGPTSADPAQDRNRPVQVAAGNDHTCARLQGGDVWCWGFDGSGQVGDGPGGGGADPALAVDSPDAAVLTVDISAGRFNTCAAYIDMSVWCWGDNGRDQLGDGVGNAWPWPEGLGAVADTIGRNHLPDPVDDAATTAPGTPIDIDVLANDTDPDVGDTISLVFVSDPPKGTAIFSGSIVTYTPDADACDTGPNDEFEYAVRDTHGGTVLAKVAITITCPNKLPTLANDTVSVVEDETATLDVLANDTDPDGDPLTVASSSTPTYGALSLAADGTGTYTPAPDYCGPDGFTYDAVDDRGGAATAVVAITVACRQDAPVAADDAAATTEDDPVTIDVLANDTDVDGDVLQVVATAAPSHGVATIEAGDRVKYTPAPDYCGSDAFTYTITDGGRTAIATVNVTVSCSSDAPRAVDDTGTTDEDTAFVLDVLANDSDPDGDTLTITSVTDPPHGTTEIVAGGIRYMPDSDFCGADGFAYTIEDADGASDTAVANAVGVRCIQDPPQAVPDAVPAIEDTPATFPVLTNDSDPDGDDLSVASITPPDHGTASIVATGIRYEPEAEYCGMDELSYTVRDGHGNDATAIISVTVECVQDAPTLAAVPGQTTPWGDVLLVGLSANDADGDALSYSLVGAPVGATVDDAGVIRWQPDEAQVGTATLTARVSDGARTAERQFEVKVTRRATAIAWTGATTGTWSDRVGVSAVLADAVTGTGVRGRAVTFKIGSGPEAAATSAEDGTASAELTVGGTVGTTKAVAAFGGDGAWAPAKGDTAFTVLPESATVSVTRSHLTLTSATTADVTLSVTVTEDADGRLGGGLATTRVNLTTVPDGRTCTAPISGTTPGAGSGSCMLTGVPLGSRAVVAVLDAANYSAPVDVTAFAVGAPRSGGGAGGGEVGETVQRSAFAFTAKADRKAGPSGDAVQVWRVTTDLGVGPREYALVAHGLNVSALSTSCDGKTKSCALSLKVTDAAITAIDLTTGGLLSLPGGSTIEVWATDVAEPVGDSVPPDRYAVKVGGSGYPFSLGDRTDQRQLTRGNVRVPS